MRRHSAAICSAVGKYATFESTSGSRKGKECGIIVEIAFSWPEPIRKNAAGNGNETKPLPAALP
jgi:hypothetical protein